MQMHARICMHAAASRLSAHPFPPGITRVEDPGAPHFVGNDPCPHSGRERSKAAGCGGKAGEVERDAW